MKATARHRAHRKRRRDSGIVGQATTNEPIDTRVPACYACSTLVLVGSGRGTASVWLATFKPMSCLFSPVVAGALQRPRAATLRPRPPTAVEAVNLRIHRSHSTAAAINKIRKVRKTTRRHRLGQTSCAYHSPPEMHPFTPPSTRVAM